MGVPGLGVVEVVGHEGAGPVGAGGYGGGVWAGGDGGGAGDGYVGAAVGDGVLAWGVRVFALGGERGGWDGWGLMMGVLGMDERPTR